MSTYWLSPVPEKCDTCENLITDIFYDAATKWGPWAVMCPMCFHISPGLGKLGQGLGQKYVRQPCGRYLKTEG